MYSEPPNGHKPNRSPTFCKEMRQISNAFDRPICTLRQKEFRQAKRICTYEKEDEREEFMRCKKHLVGTTSPSFNILQLSSFVLLRHSSPAQRKLHNWLALSSHFRKFIQMFITSK
ncbi:hypothetical protein AVEN_131144-1 [Araneus ventricosus]|uniref:Uncharacterized protein n=1 Tax=Araneus ventricosus TaxID=182803 RepID=A0A4Y2HCG3_ARAVE|nr:hypothetical protein AVEN_131144-1 [Araneus ventricosus]